MAYRVRSCPPGPRRWSVLLRAPGSWPGWRLGSLGCRPSERGLLAVLDSGAELGTRAVALTSSAVGPVAVLLVLFSGAGFLVVAGIVVAGIGVAAGRVGPVIDVGHCASSPAMGADGSWFGWFRRSMTASSSDSRC